MEQQKFSHAGTNLPDHDPCLSSRGCHRRGHRTARCPTLCPESPVRAEGLERGTKEGRCPLLPQIRGPAAFLCPEARAAGAGAHPGAPVRGAAGGQAGEPARRLGGVGKVEGEKRKIKK